MPVNDYATMLRELGSASLSPEHLERLSLFGKTSRDPLTGLRDYRSFPADLQARLLRPGPWILTAISIDNLRELNLVSGWVVGDIAICGVAALLESLPNSADDFAGRVSGATFMVLLNQSKLNAVRSWHETFRARVAEMKLPGLELFPHGRLTVSVGFLFAPPIPPSAEVCMADVRRRMAGARSRGGDCASFIDGSAPAADASVFNAIQLEVRKAGDKKWLPCALDGLSLNGADFSVSTPFMVREDLELNASHRGAAPFPLRGPVAWRKPKDGGGLFVIGMKFAGLEPRAGEELERILTGAD